MYSVIMASLSLAHLGLDDVAVARRVAGTHVEAFKDLAVFAVTAPGANRPGDETFSDFFEADGFPFERMQGRVAHGDLGLLFAQRDCGLYVEAGRPAPFRIFEDSSGHNSLVCSAA